MAVPEVGAAQAYVEAEFGGPTTEAQEEYSVNDTVTKITDNDPERVSLAIINVGTETLYLLFDDNVSSTRGIVLDAGGGLLSLNVRDDQLLPTRRWYAVSTTTGTDVLVIETKRYAYTGLTSAVVELKQAEYQGRLPVKAEYIPSVPVVGD